LMRANQWRERLLDKPGKIIHGIKRLKFRAALRTPYNQDAWRRRYLYWRESLPAAARQKAYDFGFVEHLLPNTQGGYFGGFHDQFYMNPFNDRQIIHLAMSLPNRMRFENRAVIMALERTAPELLEFPFL